MTVRTLSADSTNDIFIAGDGNLSSSAGIDAVLQLCKHAMQTMLNEMIYDYSDGLPNFKVIWDGSPNLLQFNVAGRAALQAVAGVVRVVSFESAVTNNVLKYRADIQTQFGSAVINV
jgi:hypothetical protein